MRVEMKVVFDSAEVGEAMKAVYESKFGKAPNGFHLVAANASYGVIDPVKVETVEDEVAAVVPPQANVDSVPF